MGCMSMGEAGQSRSRMAVDLKGCSRGLPMTLNWRTLAMLVLLVCAPALPLSAQSENAQSEKPSAGAPDLRAVEHTSILWLKNRSFLDDTDSELVKRGIRITETFDDLDAVVVDMAAPDLQSVVDESPEGFAGVDYVEPNGIVT